MINEKMRSLGARRSSIRELFEYGKKRKTEIGKENVYDFSLGNPSVAPPESVDRELMRLLSEVESTALHGYTSAQGDLATREAIAKAVSEKHGVNVHADCIYMTVGAAAALTISLTALSGAGEEVIVNAPYFPEYRVFIEGCGAKVVEVACKSDTFMPDVSAIEASINERTAAIIVNSPNNPTGAVYGEEVVTELTDMLKRKEIELGHPIYLISDEPYRELVYGGASVPYLTKYYDNTIVCYSYSKSLSLPGERIGYVLVSPTAKDFTAVYQAIAGAGRSLGFVCAPSLLQKLIPACVNEVAEIEIYDRNRILLLERLTEYGFELVKPDGAFYLFIKSPSGDAVELCERAKREEILIVPSNDFGTNGYARLSYCVKTEEIERALPAFKRLALSYQNPKGQKNG